jgi:hypothetical protein
MYCFKYEDISKAFLSFAYPVYIIYPYAILKLLGLIAVWSLKFKTLKECTYAGYFYAFVLVFFTNDMIGEGQQGTAVVALIALIVSYIFNKRISK